MYDIGNKKAIKALEDNDGLNKDNENIVQDDG